MQEESNELNTDLRTVTIRPLTTPVNDTEVTERSFADTSWLSIDMFIPSTLMSTPLIDMFISWCLGVEDVEGMLVCLNTAMMQLQLEETQHIPNNPTLNQALYSVSQKNPPSGLRLSDIFSQKVENF